MPMLHTIRGLLLHLGEHVADDLGVLVGVLLGAGDVDGDVAELGPGQRVVQVVLEEVVFGQVFEVGVLDEGEVGGGEDADVHCGGCEDLEEGELLRDMWEARVW